MNLDRRHVSCQTGYLVRVGIGRSNGSHETDSPFHAIPNISRILNISAVLTVGMDEGNNEAHYHDSIL